MPLNTRALPSLRDRLPTPAYARGKLRAGIVHFGVGGFHRAHEAMYLDRLMTDGKALDWAICGVGVMPADRRMKEVMDAQDGLYTLVVKRPDGSRKARVVGSIVGYPFPPPDPDAALEPMAHPQTRAAPVAGTPAGHNCHALPG